MNKKILVFTMLLVASFGAAHAGSPIQTINTLPYSNETAQVVIESTATAPSAVTVSSSVITQIDIIVATDPVSYTRLTLPTKRIV